MLPLLKNNEIIVHFVLLCEIFFNSLISHRYQIPGYKFTCVNRTSQTRGGDAMYIANSCTYKERNDLCINIVGQFESIAVEISDKLHKQNTVVAEVYRIPHTNELLSIQRYEETVTNICGNTNQVILGIDMNFDYKKVGEHKKTTGI